MNAIASSITYSALVSSALTGLIVFITKTWISERIKQAIQHEYATRLEEQRSTLKAEYDMQLERLRADIARRDALESSTRTALSAVHLASHERRVSALENAWKAVIAMRNCSSAATLYLDIMTDNELSEISKNERACSLIRETSASETISSIAESGKDIERLRLFIGDSAFAFLYSYRAILSRVELLLERAVSAADFSPWWEDALVRQHLALVLTEDDVSNIARMPVNRFSYVRACLELGLLGELSAVLSGATAVQFSAEKAMAIAKTAALGNG